MMICRDYQESMTTFFEGIDNIFDSLQAIKFINMQVIDFYLLAAKNFSKNTCFFLSHPLQH